MKKLLEQTAEAGRVQKSWLHYGEDGREKVTVEHKQDVEPVINYVKTVAQSQNNKGMLRYKATVDFTHMDDISKQCSQSWGVSVREAFSEIMQGKTGRAQRALKTLTEGRDFRKLQAQHY